LRVMLSYVDSSLGLEPDAEVKRVEVCQPGVYVKQQANAVDDGVGVRNKLGDCRLVEGIARLPVDLREELVPGKRALAPTAHGCHLEALLHGIFADLAPDKAIAANHE